MAEPFIIECPTCKHQVSTNAISCSSCHVMLRKPKRGIFVKFLISAFSCFIVLIILLVWGGLQNAVKTQTGISGIETVSVVPVLGIPTKLPEPVNTQPTNPTTIVSLPQPINVNTGPLRGKDTVGGLVSSNEARLNNEADKVGFIDATKAAFTSGDNDFMQLYKNVERKRISPDPDLNFDVETYIKSNNGSIPQQFEHKVRLADNQFEAELIVQDMLKQIADQDMLSRRAGVSTFVARALASVVDIGMLLLIGLGMVFKGGMATTKWGQFVSSVSRGALIGCAALASAQALGSAASTTGDWTSVPAAGLAGMALGGMFGAFIKAGSNRLA